MKREMIWQWKTGVDNLISDRRGECGQCPLFASTEHICRETNDDIRHIVNASAEEPEGPGWFIDNICSDIWIEYTT